MGHQLQCAYGCQMTISIDLSTAKPCFWENRHFILHFLNTDPTLSKMDFVNNLQVHPAGSAIFRKEWTESDGSNVIERIYLHKFIADNYLAQRGESQVLIFKNANKLDCRLENLEYALRER